MPDIMDKLGKQTTEDNSTVTRFGYSIRVPKGFLYRF
jgi:hypothetical protein